MRDTEKMEIIVQSGDRAGYQRKGTLQLAKARNPQANPDFVP